MKKGFGKKIIFLGVSLILGISTVNASCALTGIASTTNGYVQGSTNCDLMMYCVSYGKKQIDDTNECKVYQLNGAALSTIQDLGGDSIEPNVLSAKLAAFRYWSQGTTLNTGSNINYNSLDSLGKEYVDSVKGLSKEFTKTSIDGKGNFNFTLQSSNQSGSSYTATVLVTSEGGITGNLSFKASNGTNIVSSNKNANGSYTLVISGTIEECEGANPTIYVYSSSPGDSQSTTIPGIESDSSNFYYFDCGRKQHYIGFTQDSNTKTELRKKSSTTIDEIPGKSLVGEGTVSIPDNECKCSGTTTLEGECGTSPTNKYYVKDSEDIKKCITSGKYKSYCGKNIKKNDDNNGYSDKTNITQEQGIVDVQLASNPYCSVYCAEYIEYNMPGIIKTRSGSYFKLRDGFNIDDLSAGKNISITGKRVCYTNAIKKSKYIEDVREAQEAIVNAYNDYLKEKAEKESIENATSESITLCTSSSCDKKGNSKSGTSVTGTKYTGKEVKYKQYNCNFDAEGGYSGCSTSNAIAKVEWQDTISASSSTSCSKSGNAVSCGTVTAAVKPVRNPDGKWSKVKSKLEEMYKIINKYKSCFEWNNNYCFDPKIEFSYNEPYDMNGELKGKLEGSEDKSEQFSASVIETQDLSGSYNKTVKQYIKIIRDSAPTYQNSLIDMNDTYVAKSVKKTKVFEDATKEVYSYHPYGTISLSPTCDITNDKKGNCIPLGKVLPVALQHTGNGSELYNYSLKISNIGVIGNDSSCSNAVYNRIMGESCSLYNTEVNKPIDNEYTCQYSVTDCPECTTECKCPEGSTTCYVEDKVCKYVECPTCTVKCVGCVWGSGNSTFAYKQVSVSKIFPNSKDNKDVGYNWNVDSQVNKEYKKAKETIKEIEENKQEVYSKPEYSYTLTPQTMSKIRAYNKAANEDTKTKLDKFGDVDTGGYNNDTLKCSNGNECKSTFLDGLDKIVGTNNRVRNENWETYNGSPWK